MPHDMSAMREALKRKRARGLDLVSVEGGAEPINAGQKLSSEIRKEDADKKAEHLGLAPEGAHGSDAGGDKAPMNPAHADEAQDVQMMKDMMGAKIGKRGFKDKAASYHAAKGKKGY